MVPRREREEVLRQKRPRDEGGRTKNAFFKIARREDNRLRAETFRKLTEAEKYRNMRLFAEVNTHSPNNEQLQLEFMRRRSKVMELIAAEDVLFALAHSGACAVFERGNYRRIGFLNLDEDEVVRSLFYNTVKREVITVSVTSRDHYSSLRCRSVPLEAVREGRLDEGEVLFNGERLKWPGFVEFDDVNRKVIMYYANGEESVYRVYSMERYELLYEVAESGVSEIKISPGILLIIFEPGRNHIPMRIVDMESGENLRDLHHFLHIDRKVEFIEQFNEKLLIKQEDTNMQILDVRDGTVCEVDRYEFPTPRAFIFLYDTQLFLTFRKRIPHVWNFRGELVTSFEDHELMSKSCMTNNMYITSDQSTIISYCRARDRTSHSVTSSSGWGTINFANVFSGECIAKIGDSPDRWQNEHPLDEVTCIFFDESRSTLFTGNRKGKVHVWSV